MTFWSLTNSDFPTNQTFHQFHGLYTELDLHRLWVVSMKHLQRVWHASRERLPVRTPGSVPHCGTCLCSNCWDQIPRTCHAFTRLFTSLFGLLSKLLASLMRNNFLKRPSDAPLHTLSKLYDVPVGFVPPHYFEPEYCLFCGRRRVAVARYRMICLVLRIPPWYFLEFAFFRCFNKCVEWYALTHT